MKKYLTLKNLGLGEIQLGEDGAAVQVGGEVLDVGQRVAVVGGGQVQTAVVAARPPGAVRLGHHVQGRRPRRQGAADNASLL